MKASFITLSILFLACFMASGQSLTLMPTSTDQVSVYAYSAQRPTFSGYHSTGVTPPRTATLSGRMLVGLQGYGYTGTAFNSSPNASIELKATENFGATAQGADISFYTTANGNNTSFERMRIGDNGNVGIGTFPSTTTRLEVRTPTQNYGIQHSDGTVNLATYLSNQTGGWLGTRTNHPLSFYVNSGSSKLSIATTGNVTVADFTKLGSDAPAIKQKIITGFNTPSFEGGSRVMAHGLTPSKILSVDIFVEAVESFSGLLYQTPPNYIGSAEMLYSYAVTPTNIELTLTNTTSGNILSKPIRVFITYME